MKTFNPIQRAYVAPVDLNTFSNTYRDLEQGHQKAVQFASQLETAMAQLDLNEAEDEWRQNKINQIKNTLAENTKYGNAAAAVDDLVKVQGNITSDAGMIGRLRAQADYKNYLANLDKRTDISEDTKNYYREHTKYYYNDKIDDKTGRVIGGSKWQPTERPVSQIDLNDVFTTALKYVSPDAGGNNVTMFLDPITGNTSRNYTPGSQLVTLNTTTNKWERLSSDKLRNAVEAAMNANPAIKASLEQDFKIDKWKHSKNPDIFTDAYDNKGYLKTFDRYVEDKIDPFIEAKKYNHYYTSVDYNNQGLNMIAKEGLKQLANAGNNEETIAETVLSHPTVKGGKLEIETTPTVDVINKVRYASSIIAEQLNEKYPDLHIPNFTIDTTDSDIQNIISNLDDNAKKDVLNYWNNFKSETLASRYTQDAIISRAETPESTAAYNMLQQLNTGNIDPISDKDSDELKKYKKDLANIRNRLIGDSYGLGISIKNDRMLNDFISEFGEDNIKKYNIKIYRNSGNIRVVIPADNSDGLELFATAGDYAVSQRGVSHIFNRLLGIGAGTMYAVDANGNPTEIAGLNRSFETGIKEDVNISSLKSVYDHFRNNLYKKQYNMINAKGIVDTDIIPFASPYGVQQYSEFQTAGESKEANIALKRMEEDNKKYANALNNNPAGIYSMNIKIVDNTTGEVRTMNTEDKDNFITDLKDNKVSSIIQHIPNSGYRPAFTLNNNTYIIMDGYSDPSFEQVNNSVPVKALNKYQRLTQRQEAFQFPLGNNTVAIGISKSNNGGFDVIVENEHGAFIPAISDVHDEIIKSAAKWSAVYDKIQSGEFTEQNKDTIANAYNELLRTLGYDENARSMLTINMMESL